MIYVHNIINLFFLAINYRGVTFAAKQKKIRIESWSVGALVVWTCEILEKINHKLPCLGIDPETEYQAMPAEKFASIFTDLD